MPIEGYKNIPGWVCRNLILYNNCYVNDTTYKKIHKDVIEYMGGKNKFLATKCEDGGYILCVKM